MASNYDTYTISVRSVNDMWPRLCDWMIRNGIKSESRNGKVLRMPGPTTIIVHEPWIRVLEDRKRECNHVFHLMESMWMLAGSNDVAFVEQFNHNISSYSDDGKVFNAAYGYRWREHFGFDQVEHVIQRLRDNPYDRRAVITMWDPRDMLKDSLDYACNMQVIPFIRDGKLWMTTTNRSNDMVWGLCGANCVHLSYLHEYMARSLGLPMGKWIHITNNLHVYDRHFDLICSTRVPQNYLSIDHPMGQPLVSDPDTFLHEVKELVAGKQEGFCEPFLEDTIEPVWASWRAYKAGDFEEAIYVASCIEDDAWRPEIMAQYERIQAKRAAK